MKHEIAFVPKASPGPMPRLRETGGTGRRRDAALLAACLLLAGGALGLASPASAAPHPAKKIFPQVDLDRHVRGDEAVSHLGGKLPAVAAWYGMSPQTFARMLREDRMAWLDRKGRLLFIDDHRPPEPAAAASGEAVAAGAYPAEQTFLLHSRPGAKRVIYLDFNGQVVTGTAWNSSYGLAGIDAQAFDLDGSPATFSGAELDRIQAIWQRVAEDYAPFDVDVTTEEPPAEAITRSGSADLAFGTRVVVSRDWTKQTASPCGCGGFAYVGIYDDYGDAYKPAFVFFDNLGGGNEKYVAEAISHEAGHNLGLSHDGTTAGVSYYGGHGSGATGWAPIMGVGYYRELTQWSKGEYASANQAQDDLLVIQGTGAPLRADDHGDTPDSATPLDGVGTSGGLVSLAAAGLVGTRADVDVFSFASAAGNVSFSASPAARGANLDIGLSLYDGDGALLASANPGDLLGAGLNAALAAGGTYYLVVAGVGKGDPSTGYSDYASLGEYSLAGTVPAPSGLPPVAVATATPNSGTAPVTVVFSGAASHDPDGGALGYAWDFGDGSAPASGPDATHVYTVAGSYTAVLRVTDASGAADTAQVGINVAAAAPRLHVGNIAMALTVKRGSAQASATVTVLDARGVAIPGATVTGAWSGIVNGGGSGVTGSAGTVKLSSPSTKKAGTFTFTITGIALSGYAYDASANLESRDSISR